jgi:hypothetical protein
MAIQESVCFGKHLNGRYTLDTQTNFGLFVAIKLACLRVSQLKRKKLKGLILAQNERWRRGLGMQVERE